jgi:hypothetical protein
MSAIYFSDPDKLRAAGFVVAAKGVSLFSFVGVVCAAREKIILWP